MLELLVLGALALAGLFVLGFVGLLAGFVFWVLVLPFRILGWVLHGVFGLALGAVLFPVLIVVGALALGAGVIALALPFAPVIALGVVLWWLLRRGRGHSARPTVP